MGAVYIIAGVVLVVGGVIAYWVITKYQQNPHDLQGRVDDVVYDKTSSNQNRFAAKREEGAAKARAGANRAAVEEASTIREMIGERTQVAEAQAHFEDTNERVRKRRELEEKQHELALAIAENSIAVTQRATVLGVTPGTLETMIRGNHELIGELLKLMLTPNPELESKRLEAEVYQEQKEADFEYDQLSARLAKHMAKVKMMPNHLQLNELHKQFSELLLEIEEAKKLPRGERKRAELERLRSREDYFRQEIERLQTRPQAKKHEFKFDDDEDV